MEDHQQDNVEMEDSPESPRISSDEEQNRKSRKPQLRVTDYNNFDWHRMLDVVGQRVDLSSDIH